MDFSIIVKSKSRPFPVGEGEVIFVQTAGADGYGEPMEREMERVQADVVDGVVSAESAAKVNGVVLHPESLVVDPEATKRLRATMRA